MYCPHCDYFTDDDDESECPRCAIRLSPAHLADPVAAPPARPTGLRLLVALVRHPGEWRQLFAFTLRDLQRLGVMLAGAGLLTLGTCLPVIGIDGAGRYNLLQLAALITVLRKVAAIEGAGLMLVPLLGKIAIVAILLGAGSAMLRWRGGISLASSLSLIVTFIALGVYYNLMRQVGPELERRLAVLLQQRADDVIHAYPVTVLALVVAAALFQFADWRMSQPYRRRATRRVSRRT